MVKQNQMWMDQNLSFNAKKRNSSNFDYLSFGYCLMEKIKDIAFLQNYQV